MAYQGTRRASLEVLRAEAADELSVLVDERLRLGEDPWEFMEELPDLDELVVLLLRAEKWRESKIGPLREPENFLVLREISLQYPELSPAVWRVIDTAG